MRNLQDNPLALDELDLMLIAELEQDARISYLALASKLGTSQPTVRRRLNRLIDQGIIQIAAIPAYHVLGYKTVLVLAINAPPGTLDTLTRQLASADRTKFLWLTAGHYNILAVTMYQSHDEYMKSFPDEFGGIRENVKIETMWAVSEIKSDWTHLRDNDINAVSSHSPMIPTELDLSVIGALQESPRASAKELAVNVGASPSSVRSSLRKVLSQQMARVVSIPDSAVLEHSVWGVVLINVHPSGLRTLTEKLKVCRAVKRIVLFAGAFNCMIWTAFQNSAQMADFLAQDLGNIPGVLHYESLIRLKTHKRELVW